MYKIIYTLICLTIFISCSVAEDNFVSLKKNKVNVRYGPSFESDIKFVYKKINLPLKQIDKKENFRRIIDLKNKLFSCSSCGNIADEPICSICINPNRDHNTICVVEDIRDVMAIESTSAFKGIYHVLDGLISPLDGIG